MSLTLYSHPFSSYCQKVLVALYENDVAFEYRTLEDPSAMTELKARWPFARFPILVDDGRTDRRVDHHHRAPDAGARRPGSLAARGPT